jgi:PAS domain S-box-containing protein
VAGSIEVLHVDDDLQYAELTATYLHRENERLDVEIVTSASEGLTAIAQNDFDCIISDYDMPDQNGIEFLQAIRETEPELPFILYTGKGSEAVASEAIAAGVTDYLQKEGGSSQYEVLANRIQNTVDSHRATERAEDTQEWANTLLEYSSDFVLIIDETGRITYVSPSVSRVLGHTPDELTGADAFDFVHPDDVEEAADTFAESLNRPTEEVNLKCRIEHSDGGHRWLEMRGQNLVDDQVIGGVLANARDITERKEIEEKRQISEYAIESALSGIGIANLDGELVTVNPSFLDLWGYETKDEVLGKSVTEFWKHPDEAAKVTKTIEETGHWSGELLAVRKDGSTFHAQTSASIVTGDDGTPLALMSSFMDITARKKRDRERQKQIEQLEEFASVVSHDLRNPLNVATGRLQLAQDEYDGDHLEPVETALGRMDAIIEDTLVLAQEGQRVGDPESVPIHQFTQQCWEMVETPEATLEINGEFLICADQDRLSHVFENLFRNAVEHSEEAVTISVGQLDDVGFYVEDDGPGIPEEERTEVLEAGYSRSAEGTGFGLAIVNRIADAHNWTLSITDSTEGGARFEFTNVDIHESERTAEESV